MKQFIFVLSLCFVGINALYSDGDEVVELTPDNFHKLVISSEDIWIVEFYAPWCGHCKTLVPEYKKAAKALKGVIKVGAIDAKEHSGLSSQYNVRGYPTLKIFGADKFKPTEYKSSRTAKDIADACLKAATEKVNVALNGGKSSESGGSSGGSDVVELTDSNFDKNVIQSDDMWLVEFFAPWCGHCKTLEPEWKKAAAELKGKVKLGALDATVNSEKSNEYGVEGYPTIKFFNKGNVEEYNGGRKASDIVQWANSKVVVNIPAPEVFQIIDSKSVKKAFQGHPICVITVLPHILDCQSECRNEYIKMLTELGAKFKDKMWGWVWAEAMAQPALEKSLDMEGIGYPTLAVVSAKKKQYALFKGSFGTDGLSEFFRGILYGRGNTSPLKGAKLPEIITNEPWDGKDGVLEDEEDMDTDELDDVTKGEL